MNEIAIAPLDRAEIVFEPWAWPFARERRPEIDRHFRERCRERTGIWNGRVLMLHRHRFAGGEFHGGCFDTDYASFLSWRDWDCPDRSVNHYFAVPALRTSDGGFVLGEMGAHTAAAGAIYFPCGTPEPGDLVEGKVDLEGSIRREVAEETGLDIAEFAAAPGWTAVVDGARIALVKLLQSRQTAGELRSRICRHLEREKQPELANIHIVKGPADLRPRMPNFVTAFLTDAWRRTKC